MLPQSVDKLPVRSGCQILMKLKDSRVKGEKKNKGGEVRTVPLTLLEKINALRSGSFRLFVAGFTWSGEKIKAYSVNR